MGDEDYFPADPMTRMQPSYGGGEPAAPQPMPMPAPPMPMGMPFGWTDGNGTEDPDEQHGGGASPNYV